MEFYQDFHNHCKGFAKATIFVAAERGLCFLMPVWFSTLSSLVVFLLSFALNLCHDVLSLCKLFVVRFGPFGIALSVIYFFFKR